MLITAPLMPFFFFFCFSPETPSLTRRRDRQKTIMTAKQRNIRTPPGEKWGTGSPVAPAARPGPADAGNAKGSSSCSVSCKGGNWGSVNPTPARRGGFGKKRRARRARPDPSYLFLRGGGESARARKSEAS